MLQGTGGQRCVTCLWRGQCSLRKCSTHLPFVLTFDLVKFAFENLTFQVPGLFSSLPYSLCDYLINVCLFYGTITS